MPHTAGCANLPACCGQLIAAQSTASSGQPHAKPASHVLWMTPMPALPCTRTWGC